MPMSEFEPERLRFQERIEELEADLLTLREELEDWQVRARAAERALDIACREYTALREEQAELRGNLEAWKALTMDAQAVAKNALDKWEVCQAKLATAEQRIQSLENRGNV